MLYEMNCEGASFKVTETTLLMRLSGQFLYRARDFCGQRSVLSVVSQFGLGGFHEGQFN